MLATLNNRTDLLTPETPTAALVVLFLLAAGCWWALHHWKQRLFPVPMLKIAGMVIRVLVGMVSLWALWQCLARILVLETNWSLWTHAFIAGLSVEILFLLYAWERSLVSSKLGKWLLGLRLAATAAVLLMLLQPVFAQDKKSEKRREVVVLVDDSGSMHISDQQMTVAEKMELAQFAGIPGLTDRPPLAAAYEAVSDLARQCQQASIDLDIPADYGADVAAMALEKQQERVTKLREDISKAATALTSALNEDRKSLAEEVKSQMRETKQTLRSSLPDGLKAWEEAAKGKQAFALRSELRKVQAILERLSAKGRSMVELSDQAFYADAPKETRDRLDAQASRTRAEISREALEKKRTGEASILDSLRKKYGTAKILRFGQKTHEAASLDFPKAAADDPFARRSDLAEALKHIDENYDENSLAGVLLVSDARHNGEKPVDDSARNIGRKGAPICTVLVGSQRGVKDASIITVGAPQAIFEGDKLRTRVELKADSLRGQKLKVRLLENDVEVAAQEVTVSDDIFRSTVRLAHQPKAAGIYNYAVKVDPVEGELFANNNAWTFQTAVSDDRTNVLLVDQRSRWEFRYLRNLFDSRDKSVHLQYVLMEPDEVPGAPKLNKVASAASKFGDSEASSMPTTLEEWQKFDVIILGDLKPGGLGNEVWENIRKCVSDRGAMLVMIAGPQAMPHAYTNDIFKELCPVNFKPEVAARMEGPEPAYHLELTAAGRSHVIFQQSASAMENADIWQKMPIMYWRNPVLGVKDTAEVMAYARPVELDGAGAAAESGISLTASMDPAALSKQKEQERKQALAAMAPFGVGKVVYLSFDQTWRFRYGVGDTYHHRFWGQMLRWGAGENLRAGNENARLGTDQLAYPPETPIQVMAKLMEKDYKPVTDASLYAEVTQNGKRVSRSKLIYREQSHGMYDATIEATLPPGDYEISLQGSEAERLAPNGVKTSFSVRPESNPIEFGELSVDPETANKISSLSGGKVFTPTTAEQALEKFGPPSKEKTERQETRLWDNWILLATAVGLMTVEWILRRRGGLA